MKPTGKNAANWATYAWGQNEYGQLGTGNAENVETPKIIEDLNGVKIISIDVNGNSSILITEEDKVFTAGDGDVGQLGHADLVHECMKRFREVDHFNREVNKKLSKVEGHPVKCALAQNGTLIQTSGGHLYTNGLGENGQLGHQNFKLQKKPKKVSYFRAQKPEIPVTQSIACGAEHMVVIDDTGRIYSWGLNNKGQLGAGSSDQNHWQPQLLNSSLNIYNANKAREKLELFGIGFNITQLACGFGHNVCVTSEAKVYGWGNQSHGQLGQGEAPNDNPFQVGLRPLRRPKLLATLKRPKLACGKNFSLLYDEGVLYGCGDNKAGQLGIEPHENVWTLKELMRVDLLDVKCGDDFTVCLKTDGSLLVFGGNSEGQCGLPKCETVKPTTVSGIEGKIKKFAVGGKSVFVSVQQPRNKRKLEKEDEKAPKKQKTEEKSE